MSVAADLRILWHLLLTPIRGNTHSERLENFYRGQATGYDDFRARLLPGRQQLYGAVPVPAGGRWIDMGGGTGSNLDTWATGSRNCPSCFSSTCRLRFWKSHAMRLAERRGPNVRICQADATSFQPPCETVDIVTFSYSLTMIPDWFAALAQAWRLLKPGGWIGVVDFYVSRKHAATSLVQHGWLTRTFWPTWFAMDNVFSAPIICPRCKADTPRSS